MSNGLTLYLPRPALDTPLPVPYLSVPDVQLGPGHGEIICSRCTQPFLDHDWVVYVTQSPRINLDCSIEPRRLEHR